MASLGNTFDASSIQPSNTYQALPAGKYLGQIVASEMRATKDGRGQYLYLELDIVEGPHAGRRLFDRLNLINDNEQAVTIAKQTLSSICHAVGKRQVKDSDELHLIPMVLDVRVRPPKGEYGESNSIRYQPRNGGLVGSTAAAAAASPSPQTPAHAAAVTSPAANGLPWKQRA